MKVINRLTGKVVNKIENITADAEKEMKTLLKNKSNVTIGKPIEASNYTYKSLNEDKLHRVSMSYINYDMKKSNNFKFDDYVFENI